MTATATDPKLAKRISVIKKLLNQATHPGTGSAEAEKFMGKAQEMIEQFNINQAMLADEEPDNVPADILKRTVYDRQKFTLPTWILTMAGGVAEANRCKHWYRSGTRPTYRRVGSSGKIYAAGTEDNLTAFELVMPYLVGEVDRLYLEEKPATYLLARLASQAGMTIRGFGKRWGNSFRIGCASRIAQRLRQARKAAADAMKAKTDPAEAYRLALEANDTEALLELDRAPKADPKFALAKVETALARLENDEKRTHTWVEENMKFSKGQSRSWSGSNYSAFSAGRKAGSRASLSGPKGRIG